MNGNKVILIGASAGGLKALTQVLTYLPKHYPFPILVVQHVLDNSSSCLAELLNEQTALQVQEAEDKQKISKGYVHIAPPGYHMLVELDESISLSVDPRVNFSRPSIDVLFQSAAYVLEDRCIGIILTGASSDGSTGLKAIQDEGGTVIVQSPETAEYVIMPQAAIRAVKQAHIMPLDRIGAYLLDAGGNYEQQDTSR